MKAFRSAGMLLRAFSTRDKTFVKKLYVAYMRPTLEYASVIWNPISICLEQEVERVQRRFTKALCGMKKLAYEDRLARLQLESLTSRRRRADLVMAFKAIRGGLGVNANTIGLQLATTNTRSNGSNLVTRRTINNNVRKTFEFRVCKSWNSLPSAAKSAQSLTV